jgi:hypothetical protein
MVVSIDVLGAYDVTHKTVHKCANFFQIIDDPLFAVWWVFEMKLPGGLSMDLQRFIPKSA